MLWVNERQLYNKFTEHRVYRLNLKVGSGADVSDCGRYWCYISDYKPHAVCIVEGLTSIRGIHEPEGSEIRLVQFTPHVTVLFSQSNSLKELDLDGRVVREFSIGFEKWTNVTCTPKFVIVSDACMMEVYDYETGVFRHRFCAVGPVNHASVLYSRFTKKLYAQGDRQKTLWAFTIDDNGFITVQPSHIRLPGLIGTHHWYVTDKEELVLLDDLAGGGIRFRGRSVNCKECGMHSIRVIPGGFFTFDDLSVHFIKDNFTYTMRELFLTALIV